MWNELEADFQKIIGKKNFKFFFYVLASNAEYFKKPFKMFHLHPSNGFLKNF